MEPVSTKKYPYDISFDSAKIYYDAFDIKKDCFDCSPGFSISISYSDSISRLIVGYDFILINEDQVHDTLLLTKQHVGANTVTLGFGGALYELCGYYEKVRAGYTFLSKGKMFYKSNVVDTGSFNIIPKGEWFKIEIDSQKIQSKI